MHSTAVETLEDMDITILVEGAMAHVVQPMAANVEVAMKGMSNWCGKFIHG